MTKPAPWWIHDAGLGAANNARYAKMQTAMRQRCRNHQKPRLGIVTGDSVACGRLTAAHGVERLLGELDKPNPELVSRGCRAGKRKPRIVGGKLVSIAS